MRAQWRPLDNILVWPCVSLVQHWLPHPNPLQDALVMVKSPASVPVSSTLGKGNRKITVTKIATQSCAPSAVIHSVWVIHSVCIIHGRWMKPMVRVFSICGLRCGLPHCVCVWQIWIRCVYFTIYLYPSVEMDVSAQKTMKFITFAAKLSGQ